MQRTSLFISAASSQRGYSQIQYEDHDLDDQRQCLYHNIMTFGLRQFISRHLVYCYFVYYDFLAEIEAGVMKRTLYQ